MRLAIVGATGLVGQELLKVIDERGFSYDELLLVASSRNVGKKMTFQGKEHTIISMDDAVEIGRAHV